MRYLLPLLFSLYVVFAVAQEPRLVLPIGHRDAVSIAIFSPDGKRIASIDGEGNAKIWDATSGLLLADLKGLHWDFSSVNFSHDGKRIVTASGGGTAKIWDASTGTPLVDLKGRTSLLTSLNFSPDNTKIVAVSYDDGNTKVWDALNGNLLLDLEGSNSKIYYFLSAEFSPDGKKIVTVSEAHTKIWDAFSGVLLVDLKGNVHRYFHRASFSPDGKKLVTASFDSTAKIWDAATGALLVNLKGHTSYVLDGHFSPDGNRIVTASGDSTAKIWDASSGTLLANLKVHTGEILSASFSPDGKKIVTTAWDRSYKMWNATSGVLLADLNDPKDPIYLGGYAGFSPDGKKIATTSGKTVKIWNVSTGLLLANLEGHIAKVNSASYSPDGKKIVTALGAHSKIWDASTGAIVANLDSTDNVHIASFSPDGKKIVTASDDHTLKILDVNTGRLLAYLKGHTQKVQSARFSPDGKKIVTASDDRTAKLWDAGSGALLADLGHENSVDDANFSPDGKKIVTASEDHTAKIWKILDAQSAETKMLEDLDGYAEGAVLLVDLKGHTSWVTSASFSPDGKKIVTASADQTAKIWDAESGELLVDLKGHTGDILSASFSPDGKKIVTASHDSTAKIWDASSGALLADLKAHTNVVADASFSPNSKKVVTASIDETAKIWDAQSGHLLENLIGHTDAVLSAKFSYDGDHILTTSNDNTLKVWGVQTGTLIYTFFPIDSTGYFTQIPAGFYRSTPNAAKLLHYADKDLKVITFEQLDVKYNRPDLVLEGIGCPDTAIIQSYRKAYERRIKKLGFDTILFKGQGLHVPESEIQNRDSIEYEQTSNKLVLRIHCKDDSLGLDRFNIWINEVPLLGVRGWSIKKRSEKQFDTTLIITLSDSTNRIETSVTNVGGLESYRRPIDVKYTPLIPSKVKLYFIGIGIDHFNDRKYNLSWSVKDIRDLARNFKEKYGAQCFIDTLFNKNVTLEKVNALKKDLINSTVNDKVIVAYSGHGLLSDSLDYFLSAYHVDFHKPENGGLPYESLEELLDSIPARKKLMLLDACHSGEVDKEEMAKMQQVQKGLDSTKRGTILFVDTTNRRLGIKSSFELMHELFANVTRSTGATIISAASGTQFALERGDLENGVFTYCIRDLMKKKKNNVTISELKKYVNENVAELTKGLQQPTSRNENLVMDWNVW